MLWFKTRREAALERNVAEQIEKAARSEQLRRAAEERAARTHDVRGGLLAIHQPHAQAADGMRAPLLYCTECASSWPCRTIQFAYAFGEFDPSTISLPVD